MLSQLGLSAKAQRDYNTKFGITLAKRNAIAIEQGRNLIAESSFTEVEANSEALDQLQKDFDIQPGDVDMLVLDQVIQDEYRLPQTVTIASTQTSGAKKIPKIGRCDISRTFEDIRPGSEVAVSPGDDAAEYFAKIEVNKNPKMNFGERNHARVNALGDFGGVQISDGHEPSSYKVLEGPTNGVWKNYRYVPNPGFTGKDRIAFQVTGYSGKSVIVTHFINVINKDVPLAKDFWLTGYKKYCPNRMELRKISQSNSRDASIYDPVAWQRSADLSALLANASQSLTGFADLAVNQGSGLPSCINKQS